MKEHVPVPCKDCKGIRRDGTGICSVCGSRWMACKLLSYKDGLICVRCKAKIKNCPNCGYEMTTMPIYTGKSLVSVDGWHCPKCQYDMVKT